MASCASCLEAKCGGFGSRPAASSFFIFNSSALFFSKEGWCSDNVTVRSASTSSGSPLGTYSVIATSCARVAAESNSNTRSTKPSFTRRCLSFSRRKRFFSSARRVSSVSASALTKSVTSFEVSASTASRVRVCVSIGESSFFCFAYRISPFAGSTPTASASVPVSSPSTSSFLDVVLPPTTPPLSIASSDAPSGRHVSHPFAFTTVRAACDQVLFKTQTRASHRLCSSRDDEFWQDDVSFSASSSEVESRVPSTIFSNARIRNRSGVCSNGPEKAGCHRVSTTGAFWWCRPPCVLSPFFGFVVLFSPPGPPPLPLATSMPTSSSQTPIFKPGLSEHTMVTEVLQFLLFSIPQCLSHPVVVSTLPSPTPDTATQFSRLSSHMHRNMALLERKTPGCPPHRAGTAACATFLGFGGGISRGWPSARLGSSCASSSSAVMASTT
mmetsp:Transcript_2208/g.8496  ORF Transcript_2208/g.8496 Transcript_2208/m.8496 type:complete len:441 (-) Transcript_2208:1634-2956(-)